MINFGVQSWFPLNQILSAAKNWQIVSLWQPKLVEKTKFGNRKVVLEANFVRKKLVRGMNLFFRINSCMLRLLLSPVQTSSTSPLYRLGERPSIPCGLSIPLWHLLQISPVYQLQLLVVALSVN